MSLGRWALAAAWVVSVLPAVGSGTGFEPASATAWALLPWLLLAGAPGAGRERTRPVVAVALALPPLALGLGLDRGAGVPSVELSTTLLFGWLQLALLVLAADRAVVRPVLHGVVWFALVPGAFVAVWALEQGGVSSAWLRLASGLSPLTWAAAQAADPLASEGLAVTAFAAPLLCLAATVGRRP